MDLFGLFHAINQISACHTRYTWWILLEHIVIQVGVPFSIFFCFSIQFITIFGLLVYSFSGIGHLAGVDLLIFFYLKSSHSACFFPTLGKAFLWILMQVLVGGTHVGKLQFIVLQIALLQVVHSFTVLQVSLTTALLSGVEGGVLLKVSFSMC